MITPTGIDGDIICDLKHHGGTDQAVYAYSETEAQTWSESLGRPLPYGWFGENLRIDGLPVTDAVVGEQWHIGSKGRIESTGHTGTSVVLEVTIPRVPCRTFATWSGEDKWVKRFTQRTDVGAYLRVIEPGYVQVGDDVTVIHRPDHGIRVRSLFAGDADVAGLQAIADDERYAGKVHRDVEKLLRIHASA